MFDFNYVDAIIIDTPILNQDIKLSDAKTLEEKIKREEIFNTYLTQQWKELENFSVLFDWQTNSQK